MGLLNTNFTNHATNIQSLFYQLWHNIFVQYKVLPNCVAKEMMLGIKLIGVKLTQIAEILIA